MRTLQDIQPGQTLGRYEFLIPIAEGGMASVWAARLKGTRGFSKTVAVKTMLPNISDDPQFEQMFLDEAQIASRIRHPNVVEILDLGEQDDVLYLVMEWVDGEPLGNLRRAALKQGGIPRGIAIRIVADACAGLHAAHELKEETGALLGLVHRDISPQNILITYDGVVKIVDFGVAKAAGRSSQATTAGQVKGKPPYMSPEQALGEGVDRRTDVFALGIILYQLTTGKHPFRGESDLVTLQNIVSDKPIVPPRAYDNGYPRRLEGVVMKALDRDRDRRYQSCAELEAALDDVFAKEIPRARTEDVGRFVTAMLGHKGEERRGQLKQALKQADERAAAQASMPGDLAGFGGRPTMGSLADGGRPSLPGAYDGTPVSGVSSSYAVASSGGAAMSGPAGAPFEGGGTDPRAPATPFGATIPAPGGLSARATGWVVGATVALVAALGFGAVMLTRSGDEGAAASSPASSSTPAVAAPADESSSEADQRAQKESAKSEGDEDEPVAAEGASETESAALADAGAAADPVEPAATKAAPAPKPRRTRQPKRTATPKPKAVAPKPKPKPKAVAPKPKPKKKTSGSGFVPPPMSDPGF